MNEMYWKTIPDDFTSRGHKWEMKKWYKVDGEIECCSNGFHCSKTILDAASYITPGWMCRVEVRGDFDDHGDKLAFREMRILRRVMFTEIMARKVAIYSAELVLPIYEKKYPDDKRPRNAIETAKRYLRGKATKDEWAAASDAAWDAAGDAAGDEWDAAGAAARVAWDAAGDEWDAAGAAARAAIFKKIERKIKQVIGAK